MNAVIFYDGISHGFYLPNTGYVDVLNYLYKNYGCNQVNTYWSIAFDRYFKDDVGQMPVIVHYNNYNRLAHTQKVQVTLYIRDGTLNFYQEDKFLWGLGFIKKKQVIF